MGLFNFKREIKWDKDVMKVTDSMSNIWESIVDEMSDKMENEQTSEVLRHFNIDMGELREYLRDKEEWRRKQEAAIPKWIPVADVDNLPKKSTPCLVASNQWGGEKVRKATYLDSEKRFFEGAFDITEYVTHWMPSPEPPKEKGEEATDDGNRRYICPVCGYIDKHIRSAQVPYCWHCGSIMQKMKVEE